MKSVKFLFAAIVLMAVAVSCAKEFTTTSVQASVTAESSNVGGKTATISGKLTVESSGTFTKSAELYYSSTESTLDALKSSGIKKILTLGEDGGFSIVADMLSINTKYYYCVVAKVDEIEFITSVKSFTTLDYQTPELVDLGLSVKWASFNLGASKPEEYGSYYQWAGTKNVTDKSIYVDWSNCPYHTGSDSKTGWTKYIPSGKSSYWSGTGSPDNTTVLDPEDDVAHVKLGGEWRMPTNEEWYELTNNCTWTWTNDYKGTGIPGRIVTSNKSGYTDKSIFLPAAGYRSGDGIDQDGSRGWYWSSSLYTFLPYCAYYLNFSPDFVNTSRNNRYDGRSVRPVSE